MSPFDTCRTTFIACYSWRASSLLPNHRCTQPTPARNSQDEIHFATSNVQVTFQGIHAFTYVFLNALGMKE